MIECPYGPMDRMDAISRAFAAHISHPGVQDTHGGFVGISDPLDPNAPNGAAENVETYGIVRPDGTIRDFDF